MVASNSRSVAHAAAGDDVLCKAPCKVEFTAREAPDRYVVAHAAVGNGAQHATTRAVVAAPCNPCSAAVDKYLKHDALHLADTAALGCIRSSAIQMIPIIVVAHVATSCLHVVQAAIIYDCRHTHVAPSLCTPPHGFKPQTWSTQGRVGAALQTSGLP